MNAQILIEKSGRQYETTSTTINNQGKVEQWEQEMEKELKKWNATINQDLKKIRYKDLRECLEIFLFSKYYSELLPDINSWIFGMIVALSKRSYNPLPLVTHKDWKVKMLLATIVFTLDELVLDKDKRESVAVALKDCSPEIMMEKIQPNLKKLDKQTVEMLLKLEPNMTFIELSEIIRRGPATSTTLTTHKGKQERNVS